VTTPEPRRWRRVDFHEEHGHIVADVPKKPMRVFTLLFSLFLSSLAGIRELLRKISKLSLLRC
jgi:hypothetical protein